MRASPRAVLFVLCLLGACRKAPGQIDAGAGPGPSGPRLTAVGPKLLSNETSQPVTVVGTGLRAGMRLALGPPAGVTVPLTVVDPAHAYARLPAHLQLGKAAEVQVEVSIPGVTGTDHLIFANDTRFPDLVALAVDPPGHRAYVASRTEDVVYVVDIADGGVSRIPVGDGPTALAALPSGRVAVGHRFEPGIRLVGPRLEDAPGPTLPAPRGVTALAAGPGGLFAAEEIGDTVSLFPLDGGAPGWTVAVAPNTGALAVGIKVLAVGSLQAGVVELLDPGTGALRARIQPDSTTAIVGGPTRPYARFIMGGKAVRALAYSPRLDRLFVSSIGPNIGPNPDRWEVSMNGGVGVVGTRFERHLGFGGGVAEGLAVDDARGLLYVADVGVGVVRVVDARALAGSDATAAAAVKAVVEIPPPPGFPLIRPPADLGVNGRATASLHSGPRQLALAAGGTRLVVLDRFTGTVAVLDVSRAAQGTVQVLAQIPVTAMLEQRNRRLGQVLYFTDLSRSAMTCDTCHLEGHTEGVFFEKTHPLRIYRSTTVRGSRITPPYFTPASTFSMGQTASFVGARNRYHNPDPSPEETDALTLYSSLIPTLPNPHVGPDGAPVQSLALPDGRTGNPRAGLALFEGKAGCADCHPAPHFTTDQDPSTRGRFLDVGTPRLTPLREELQDPTFRGFAPPSLNGAWDVFPMLTTGMAGLAVSDGGVLTVADRFCLRAAVERWAPTHGRADLLTPAERDDLLAYVLSL